MIGIGGGVWSCLPLCCSEAHYVILFSHPMEGQLWVTELYSMLIIKMLKRTKSSQSLLLSSPRLEMLGGSGAGSGQCLR